jgi:hypothetical protein
MEIRVKRWALNKFDVRNGKMVEIKPPEPSRRYWTLKGASSERQRLNASMRATHLPWRYSVTPR